MEWKDYAYKIRELLGLKGNAVAITYSMKPPSISFEGKYQVCKAFLHARNGEVINLTTSTCSCPGGIWQLGLAEPPKGDLDKAQKEFLVNGEKLYCSITTYYRARTLSVTPPLGLADNIILSPMDKAEFRPDIILFICNAEQACRLVTLDIYNTGIPPRIEMSGSTCHQAVAYPIVTGELNVSLMDYTSRRIRGYNKEELLVSIPYHRFIGIIRSIDHCTAGLAKMEVPESFRRLAGTNAQQDLESLDQKL
jgi:uncharacterized protein (DUF169 family)